MIKLLLFKIIFLTFFQIIKTFYATLKVYVDDYIDLIRVDYNSITDGDDLINRKINSILKQIMTVKQKFKYQIIKNILVSQQNYHLIMELKKKFIQQMIFGYGQLMILEDLQKFMNILKLQFQNQILLVLMIKELRIVKDVILIYIL